MADPRRCHAAVPVSDALPCPPLSRVCGSWVCLPAKPKESWFTSTGRSRTNRSILNGVALALRPLEAPPSRGSSAGGDRY